MKLPNHPFALYLTNLIRTKSHLFGMSLSAIQKLNSRNASLHLIQFSNKRPFSQSSALSYNRSSCIMSSASSSGSNSGDNGRPTVPENPSQMIAPPNTPKINIPPRPINEIAGQPSPTALKEESNPYLCRFAETDEFSLIEKSGSRKVHVPNVKEEYEYEITDAKEKLMFRVHQVYETFPSRFDLKILGPGGQVVLIHKLLQNLSSHLLSMQIICPGGTYVGSIEEKIVVDEENPPLFEVKNSMDEVKAIVLSDLTGLSSYGLGRSVEVLSPDRQTTLGTITKKWGTFNDKLQLCIEVPENVIDPKYRASLIGLSILLSKRFNR